MDYRTFVAYPFAEHKKYSPFKSLEDYQNTPGSKIDLLISLVKHSLLHDDIQPASFDENGKAQWPLAPESPNSGTRKIIIYHEFTMMAPLILSVRHAFVLLESTVSNHAGFQTLRY
jgi:hypothetical protein